MKVHIHRSRIYMLNIAFIALLFMFFGCSSKYKPGTLQETTYLENAQNMSRNGISVTASVLSAQESFKLFGVDLESEGIQPVWLKIVNDTDDVLVFLPIALDPDYFSPNEAAFLNHRKFQKATNKKMDEHFTEYGIDLEIIDPKSEISGIVFTNIDPGIKYVNVVVAGGETTERFLFYFEVPGIQADYVAVDLDAIYEKDQMTNYTDANQLRRALESLPCCTTSSEGQGRGDPLNFVAVGTPADVLTAFIRRRWDVTEAVTEESKGIDTDNIYSTAAYRTAPMSALYQFDRRQDISFQKSRQKEGDTRRQRNQVRLWIAPMTYKGAPVWVGSVSRDIGSDLNRKQYWFAADEIDPEVDETRTYLLEDLVLSMGVSKFGWVRGVGAATRDNPHLNLLEQPWWTDGYRPVLFFDNNETYLSDVEELKWEDVEGGGLKESTDRGVTE